jgi:Cu+-exporting ATPase
LSDNALRAALIRIPEEETTMPIDPVCGMEVDEENAPGHSEYDGKDFYFCSIACQQKFAHDPGSFVDVEAA